MNGMYQKYILCKIGFFVTVCIAIIGAFYLEKDWCIYLMDADNYDIVEANIVDIKEEFSVLGRTSEFYTRMVYEKNNKRQEVKLLTCSTDYFHYTKPVKIAVRDGKGARIKPIIPIMSFGNILILISLIGSILLFILCKGYKRKAGNNTFQEDVLRSKVTFANSFPKMKYKWLWVVMLLDWIIIQPLEADSIVRLLLFLLLYSCVVFCVIKVFLLICDYVRKKK